MPFELLLPMAKRMPLMVCGQEEVPWALRGYVAGAFGRGAINVSEIGHIYGGRNAKPTKPIIVYGPNSQIAATVIVGAGEAEAAELEDLAYAAIDKQQRNRAGDRIGELRERRGLPPREQAPALISEALREHGRDRLANPSKYRHIPEPNRDWVKALPDARKLPIWRTA